MNAVLQPASVGTKLPHDTTIPSASVVQCGSALTAPVGDGLQSYLRSVLRVGRDECFFCAMGSLARDEGAIG